MYANGLSWTMTDTKLLPMHVVEIQLINIIATVQLRTLNNISFVNKI